MAVRDSVKTMVSRTRSTLDGHPEVKKEDYAVLMANLRSQRTSFMACDTTIDNKISPICQTSAIPLNAANHGLFELFGFYLGTRKINAFNNLLH